MSFLFAETGRDGDMDYDADRPFDQVSHGAFAASIDAAKWVGTPTLGLIILNFMRNAARVVV